MKRTKRHWADVLPQPIADAEPQEIQPDPSERVKVVNKRGAIARPRRGDLPKWIKAGWKRADNQKESD